MQTINQIEKWITHLNLNLEKISSKKLYRNLKIHESNCIDFASNDYLSLNSEGVILKLFKESFEELFSQDTSTYKGVGSTGSRLIRGHYDIFEQLEDFFASILDQEIALYFDSGYSANIASISSLMGERDVVFCDRLIHASLIDGIRLSGAKKVYFAHNDLDNLKKKLKFYNQSRKSRSQFWIVIESLYSMDGDIPDLKEIINISQENDALIFLDESHAIGIFGDNGGGVAKEKGAEVIKKIAVSVYPCGKALGLKGAFVCGPKSLKKYLINKARPFIFSTAPPPLIAHILLKICKIVFSNEMDINRKKLFDIVSYTNEKFKILNIPIYRDLNKTQIKIILTGSEDFAINLANKCKDNGFDIRAIRPPTVPQGESRLRICLHSSHKKENIDELFDFFKK